LNRLFSFFDSSFFVCFVSFSISFFGVVSITSLPLWFDGHWNLNDSGQSFCVNWDTHRKLKIVTSHNRLLTIFRVQYLKVRIMIISSHRFHDDETQLISKASGYQCCMSSRSRAEVKASARSKHEKSIVLSLLIYLFLFRHLTSRVIPTHTEK
jgi:hypothetical protein